MPGLRATMGWGLAIALCVGCANNYMPPLTTRGVPAEERRDYIVQNGYGIPEPVKQAFLDGYVVEGMSKELVFHLFGAADRSDEQDSHWEYLSRKSQLVTGVHFKDDKIDRIDGDPTGGAAKTSLPPTLPGS